MGVKILSHTGMQGVKLQMLHVLLIFFSVRKVLADQIYIKIGQTHGRVHMTEMVDSIENVGSYSLNTRKTGPEVIKCF